ncbi:RNA-binding protein 44 isoform X1 [Carassius carassius]|uniref:RNA-binding protein 44 isoform X1 n=1 Tax=Carassius carassius TaxID=217509 RepID=UPI0028691521|nr:RNA-binding protein 44 isoform X1 [Carassius carassius]
MWYPQPVDVVPLPFVFESHSITCEDLSARAMWPVFPFGQSAYNAVNEINVLLNFLYISQGFHNHPLYTNDGRKFLLRRSLFELVLANDYLGLTDPKLLGWFLCLTAEDRNLIKQEGGLLPFLQKHPALQVDRQYVCVKSKTRGNCIPPPTTMSSNKSRYPSFYGASQCQNCGTSCPFGSQKCRCCGFHIEISEDKVCLSENEKQLELLPNNVKEELIVRNDATVGCTQSTLNTQKTRCTQSCDYGGPAAHPPSYTKGMCPHAQCLSKLWEEVENREDTKHFKDTTTQANFSLDMELDMQSQVQRNDDTQNYQDLSYVQVEEAEYQSLDQEAMAEYYSFSNTSLENSAWSDVTQSTEATYNDSVMATKGSTELSDEPSNATMATAANSTDCFSCLGNSFELDNEPGDHQEDIRKNHDSLYEQHIEEIKVGPSLKSKCGASVSVDQLIDACGDFRACFTSSCATEVDQIFQLKNVATDTDLLAVSHEKDTQTVQRATSEKNTITEVCMSDLDVLTEEFIKLKETTDELKQLKNRKASPGGDHCRRVCGCDSAQRVTRAELRLLTLQFVMCQQHCWRRYFTSPQGESVLWGSEGLPDGIAETLHTLQKDYSEMRKQILAGIPLDNLKPLSLDSEKITTRANYSPASVLEAHLNSLDCPGSTIASGRRVDEESEEMRAPSTEDALDDTKVGGNKRDKALVLLPKQPGASAEHNPGVIKDPNSSEAWFDAEEELGSPNQDGKMEKLNERKERTDEDESNHSSLLCITSLPGNITEHEVLLWFEKYNATNVYISTFSNSMRAAIVYLKSPSDAIAAVKDLHGCSLQGHTVQVEQLHGPVSADLKLICNLPHSTSKTHTEEAAGDGLGTKGVTYTSSLGGPRCSVDRLTNVCDSPTASGTCVPQHYATMGSFDTIMARLSERHPNVGRQRIVDALLELRAKHQGFLSGLPLKSIVDMTSELLTQASTVTHI